MPHTLFAIMTVKPEHMDQACAALAHIVPLTQAEDGCITFEARRTSDGSNRMMIFEEWRDKAALEAHLEQDFIRDLFAKYENWLLKDAELVETTSLEG